MYALLIKKVIFLLTLPEEKLDYIRTGNTFTLTFGSNELVSVLGGGYTLTEFLDTSEDIADDKQKCLLKVTCTCEEF